MNAKVRILPLALIALASATSALPQAALAQTKAQDTQKQKNNWRNIGGAAAAVAGYGLLKGNTTATLLGAAGAAYSAKRYEDERKTQDHLKREHQRTSYHRSTNSDGSRQYYRYQGQLYYKDLNTGERHPAN